MAKANVGAFFWRTDAEDERDYVCKFRSSSAVIRLSKGKYPDLSILIHRWKEITESWQI